MFGRPVPAERAAFRIDFVGEDARHHVDAPVRLPGVAGNGVGGQHLDDSAHPDTALSVEPDNPAANLRLVLDYY